MASNGVPRTAWRVGNVESYAREHGWSAPIREAIQIMYRAEEQAKAALEIGRVAVYMDRGLRTTGGCFIAERNGPPVGVFLNVRWVKDREALRKTFLHEVAHAAAYLAGHPIGHNAPWRGFMEAMGLEPRVCHQNHHLTGQDWQAWCPACQAFIFAFKSRPPRRTYYHKGCLIDPDEPVEWKFRPGGTV